MKVKNWFRSVLAGVGIGVAAAVPGVSGGTIAVILKVYDKLLEAIGDLFKHFVKSFLFLLPIMLGIILGIIPCIILFHYAFSGLLFAIVCLFAGLIIGSFPGIFDEVKEEKPSKLCIFICIITGLVAVGIGVASALLGDKIDISNWFINPEWWFFLLLIPVGALASTALVVPGISGSMILLVLGFYTPLLERATFALQHIGGENFWIIILELFCFGVGVIIGFFTIAKFMSFLLKKWRIKTFWGIIGFILGSTIALFFNHDMYAYYQVWAAGGQGYLPMWAEMIVAFILLAGGIVLSYLLVRYNRKQKALQEIEPNEEENVEKNGDLQE